ncbi:MAG: threonine/serine dehydratase [Pseudomonadota bacterium]
MITKADIETAAARIAGHVRKTPIIDAYGAVLKLENLQHAGSFKPRGAFNHLLSRQVPEAGLVAASGGNHGAAVAYAARALGHPARIFVPEISAPAKVALIQRLGAEVVVGGAAYADALAAAQTWQAESGAMDIHAYDAPETVAGQGTLARELEAQAALDTLLVAVGGGGLIGGIAAWYRGSVKVVAVEPEGSCCLHAAREAGQPVDVTVGGVAADSLGARRVGEISFGICQAHVAQTLLVSDAEISAAQTRLWTELNLASEPGGATALAALLSGRYRPQPGERVGVVICGANVDLARLDTLTQGAHGRGSSAS